MVCFFHRRNFRFVWDVTSFGTASSLPCPVYLIHINRLFLLLHQLHQFVEFRGEDDFGASVFRASLGCLPEATGSDSPRPAAMMRLGAIPLFSSSRRTTVVARLALRSRLSLQLAVGPVRHIVGVPLYHHVDIRVLGQYGSQVMHGPGSVGIDFETARTEQQFIVHRHVDIPVFNRNGQAFAVEAGQKRRSLCAGSH